MGGPFTIYYTENNLCITDSFAFYIIPFDTTAAFHYDAGYYCINDVDPAPIIDGLIGGTFSSDAIIDDSTGTIDLSAEWKRKFYITYSTSDINGCSVEQKYILIDDPDGTFITTAFIILWEMRSCGTFHRWHRNYFVIAGRINFTDTIGTIDLINSSGGTYSIVNSVSDSLCSEEYVFTILILEPCVAPDTFIFPTPLSPAPPFRPEIHRIPIILFMWWAPPTPPFIMWWYHVNSHRTLAWNQLYHHDWNWFGGYRIEYTRTIVSPL